MELKFGKTADEALAQINSNHYADAFAMSNKKIIKVGIGFDIKDERNINQAYFRRKEALVIYA